MEKNKKKTIIIQIKLHNNTISSTEETKKIGIPLVIKYKKEKKNIFFILMIENFKSCGHTTLSAPLFAVIAMNDAILIFPFNFK
jgi:hypothetical protein